MKKRDNPDRLRRSRIFYSILFFLIVVLTGIFLWTMQSLILPILIGMLSAYIFLPVLNFMIRKRIPKSIAVVLLFGGFVFVITMLGRQLVQTLPNDQEKLELRVNIQYKMNHLYLDYLDKEDFDDSGNFLDDLIGDELRSLLMDFNGLIGLSDDDRSQFREYIRGESGFTPSETVIARFEATKDFPVRPQLATRQEQSDTKSYTAVTGENSKISAFLGTISNWIIMPFVFLFLLIDDGKIKRFFIQLVPNRYFEMALTTFDNVDKAIGQYLRGTLLECSLVGFSFIIGLLVIGFNLKAATLIGIVAGLANAIPFLGPVIGLVVGIIYSMAVENIEPLIYGLNIGNPIIAVTLVVLIVQLLDNALFAPVVLGKAVNLHPLVVIIGVTGGAIMFGFAGMLFAVPAIVIFNVIISTIYKQMKAYYIIY